MSDECGFSYLLEADGRHGSVMEFFPEVLRHTQLIRTELVMSEQNPHLHRDLDHVLHHLLGLIAVPCVLFGDAVKLVQNLAAVVIYEHMSHRLTGHVTEDLLLGLHGHVLRAERLHPDDRRARTDTDVQPCVSVFTCVVQLEVFATSLLCLFEEVVSSAV